MWNFLTGKKKGKEPHLPAHQIDLHSHLIPGIDDGAQTDQECLELMQGMVALGYRKCITTPHCYPGLYNNTPASISEGLGRLRTIAASYHIPLEVVAAAEYFFDNSFFELIEKNQVLTFGKNYVLFELPMNNKPSMMEEIIFNMNTNGYQPVLAHPERYPYFHDKKMADYHKLKDYGVLLQLNMMSLTGYYNADIRTAARDLIRHELVDFTGSDLHKYKHIGVLQTAMKDSYYLKLIASGKLLNHTL